MTDGPSNAFVTFDLAELERELRGDKAYLRDGHTSRSLARRPDLRTLLVAMQAGSEIAKHRANGTVSIQALSGRLRVRLPDRDADLELGSGRMLVLEANEPHEVHALDESAFLLTLGFPLK